MNPEEIRTKLNYLKSELSALEYTDKIDEIELPFIEIQKNQIKGKILILNQILIEQKQK